MATASTHVGVGARAEGRREAAAVEARTMTAFAAEGVGTFLLVFFI